MDGWQVLEQAAELARSGEPFALATVVWRQGPSSGKPGSRAIITASGDVHGWIGGACAEPAVLREARQVIADGTGRLLLLGSPGGSSPRGIDTAQFPAGHAERDGVRVVPIACQSEGALEIYIEPVLPVPHLVIVGSSPMTRTLAGLARVLGWRADLHDAAGFSSSGAGTRSLVVVATQGHGDEDALERAIAARPAYLGLVGSGKRGAAVLGYLADRGLPADQLGRVKVPAGLDLGHTSHTEIAVAILAELVKLRAAGGLRGSPPGAAASAATAEQPAAQAPPAVTDPVCGMTVAAAPSSHPLAHDGVTYYFCCAGCRARFEADPAAYLKETRC
jgi:xanthine dehydrogenase accessory factor